jgi:hypothetical protein
VAPQKLPARQKARHILANIAKLPLHVLDQLFVMAESADHHSA